MSQAELNELITNIVDELSVGADPAVKYEVACKAAIEKKIFSFVNVLVKYNLIKDYTSLLLHAVKNNCIELVKNLVDKSANVDSIDVDNKMTALVYASKNGYMEIAKILVDKGANLDLVDNDKRTALMYASRNNKTEIVKILIDKGANLDLVDNDKMTALMYASTNGYIEIAKNLVDKGANLDLVDNTKTTALIYASKNNKTEVVKILVDKGANINLVDKDKRTVLIYAARNNQTEIIKILVNKGVNLDHQDMGDNTALIWAAYNKQTENVQILVDAGTNLDLKDDFDKKAIEYGNYATKKFIEDAIKKRSQVPIEKTNLACIDSTGKEYPCLDVIDPIEMIYQKKYTLTPVIGTIVTHICDVKIWENNMWITLKNICTNQLDIQVPKEKDSKIEYHVCPIATQVNGPTEKKYVKYPADMKISINNEITTLGEIYRK